MADTRFEITVVLTGVSRSRAETLADMARNYLQSGFPGTTVTLRERPPFDCYWCNSDGHCDGSCDHQ